MSQAISLKKNENGYIIIVALLILALLTVISVSAINMSMTELKISTNELLYEKAFYAAEAGLQHVTELLRSQYLTGTAQFWPPADPPAGILRLRMQKTAMMTASVISPKAFRCSTAN